MIKKIVIAGCRNYNNYDAIKLELDKIITPIAEENTVVIVSGCCSGADKMGERYAFENGFEVERHPADWDKHGKAAGPIRNREMAEVSDYVICFWDNQSKGTKSMIDYAKKLNRDVFVINI